MQAKFRVLFVRSLLILGATVPLLIASRTGFAAPLVVVQDTGQVFSGAQYDWATGRWVVKTEQHVLFDSALDPNRNNIDPGSVQNVDYQQPDSNGVMWHYTGQRWTSNGVPHANITRAALTDTGLGLAIRQSQSQTYARPQTSPSFPSSSAQGFQSQPSPSFPGRWPPQGRPSCGGGGIYSRW